MKCATRKLRSPLKTHGGKGRLARKVVSLMPEHGTYVEPYAGGLSVLLNKPPAAVEYASDINPDLIRFWTQTKNDPSKILDVLVDMNYSENIFTYAAVDLENPGCCDEMKALAFLVRSRMSRGGLGKEFAWSERLRGGRPGDLNAWETSKKEFPAVAERVKDVLFSNCDAEMMIRTHDWSDVVIYCDPPYLVETRTAKKAYGPHEMTRDQHARLLALLSTCAGCVMLSGYHSPMYDRFLASWELHEFETCNNSGQGKTKGRRTECLWIKPSGVKG